GGAGRHRARVHLDLRSARGPDRGPAVAVPALDRGADRRGAQRVLRPALAAEGDRERAPGAGPPDQPRRRAPVAHVGGGRGRRRRRGRRSRRRGTSAPLGRRITTCARRAPVVHFLREGDPFVTAMRVTGEDPVGCVVRVETGVAVVLTDKGETRASYSGRMLADVARDRSRAPVAGDWVTLRTWPDGRVTLEECLTCPPGRVL